jgi:hypothetical protein
MIERNLTAAGVGDRATIVAGAIGQGSEQRIGYTLARVVDDPGEQHRYIGSPVLDDYDGEAISAPTYPLGSLIDLLGDEVDLAKIDCEGCEWTALTDKAAARVRRWVGEYHGDPGMTAIPLMLKGYDIESDAHDHGATGMFTAVRR